MYTRLFQDPDDSFVPIQKSRAKRKRVCPYIQKALGIMRTIPRAERDRGIPPLMMISTFYRGEWESRRVRKRNGSGGRKSEREEWSRRVSFIRGRYENTVKINIAMRTFANAYNIMAYGGGTHDFVRLTNPKRIPENRWTVRAQETGATAETRRVRRILRVSPASVRLVEPRLRRTQTGSRAVAKLRL